MTEQKLRTFKLIDREGFLAADICNEGVLKDLEIGGFLSGCTDEQGNIGSTEHYDTATTYIWESELKFFEEVTEDQENWSGEGLPPVGTICKAYHDNSGEYYDVEILKTCNDGVPEVAVCMKVNDFRVFWSSDFRPISKKTWQEKVSEEFDIDYTTSGDFKFEHFMEEERLIKMAKRIIELSEGEK